MAPKSREPKSEGSGGSPNASVSDPGSPKKDPSRSDAKKGSGKSETQADQSSLKTAQTASKAVGVVNKEKTEDGGKSEDAATPLKGAATKTVSLASGKEKAEDKDESASKVKDKASYSIKKTIMMKATSTFQKAKSLKSQAAAATTISSLKRGKDAKQEAALLKEEKAKEENTNTSAPDGSKDKDKDVKEKASVADGSKDKDDKAKASTADGSKDKDKDVKEKASAADGSKDKDDKAKASAADSSRRKDKDGKTKTGAADSSKDKDGKAKASVADGSTDKDKLVKAKASAAAGSKEQFRKAASAPDGSKVKDKDVKAKEAAAATKIQALKRGNDARQTVKDKQSQSKAVPRAQTIGNSTSKVQTAPILTSVTPVRKNPDVKILNAPATATEKQGLLAELDTETSQEERPEAMKPFKAKTMVGEVLAQQNAIHFRRRPCWNASMGVVWICVVASAILIHGAVIAIQPPIDDFRSKVVEGITNTFGFDYFGRDVLIMRNHAALAMTTCEGIDSNPDAADCDSVPRFQPRKRKEDIKACADGIALAYERTLALTSKVTMDRCFGADGFSVLARNLKQPLNLSTQVYKATLEEDTTYAPTTLEGQTFESSPSACQSRCRLVTDCAHFVFNVNDGRCELATDSATRTRDTPKVISGEPWSMIQCRESWKSHCEIAKLATEILNGTNETAETVDKFVADEAIDKMSGYISSLNTLHGLPYVHALSMFFLTTLWWLNGGKFSKSDFIGMFLCGATFVLWLFYFIYMAMACFVGNRIRSWTEETTFNIAGVGCSIAEIVEHTEETYPEFYDVVFRDLMDVSVRFQRSMMLVLVMGFFTGCYAGFLCFMQPYHRAQKKLAAEWMTE